jgi:hypothetical protein
MSILGILRRPKFALNLEKCIVDSEFDMTYHRLSHNYKAVAEHTSTTRFQLKDADSDEISPRADGV